MAKLIKINVINSFNAARQQNIERPPMKTQSTKQAVKRMYDFDVCVASATMSCFDTKHWIAANGQDFFSSSIGLCCSLESF